MVDEPGRDQPLAPTRLPAWPGPVAAITGFAVAGSAGLTSVIAHEIRPEAEPILLAIAAAGAVPLFGGLIYALVRQLRRRRVLPAHRYRGPSIVLMVVLVICLANAATLPFIEDAAALVMGDRTPSLPGAIVLLTSTQVALLVVTWAFVLAPRALVAGGLEAGSRLRALGAGIGWGALAWVGAAILTVAIVMAMEALGVPPETPIAEQAITALDPIVVVVALVILAPIAEELFFRGVAFNAWLRERGRRYAYLGSALLFAAIHASLVSLLPIFALGLALAWVYRRTRTLVGPIAMHATVNGISVTLALLARYEIIRLPV